MAGRKGLSSHFPLPFLCLTHQLLSPLSLKADLGGAFQSINSSPNKQVFPNHSLWISLSILFLLLTAAELMGDSPAWETNSADALLVG